LTIYSGSCSNEVHRDPYYIRIADFNPYLTRAKTAIDAYHDFVVSKGAELIKTLRSEPWGMREFGIRTIDGHRIMMGQDLN
jgi:hypothetical protein